jgi:hypothetical protein
MRRALAAAGSVLVLALALSGCGGDNGGAKAGSQSSPSMVLSLSDVPSPSGSVTEFPTELTALPTDLPTDMPTEVPTDSGAPSGAALDSCAVVTKELVGEHFGATPTLSTGQPSSLGDPNATDCYLAGESVAGFVKATTRAAQDMPESSNLYADFPGAEEVPGADWGTAVAVPGGGVFAVIMVKGQIGMEINLTIDGTDNDLATLQAFAQDVLAAL